MDNYSTSINCPLLACLILLVAGAFAIASCTTTGMVMQRTPEAQFASSKTVAAIAGCIAPRILRDWGLSKVAPDGGGTLIQVSGSAWGDPIAIIEVQPAASGSAISIRRGGMVTDHVFAPIVATARDCAGVMGTGG